MNRPADDSTFPVAFAGKGYLTIGDGDPIGAQFIVGQSVDGVIRAHCHARAPSAFNPAQLTQTATLQGACDGSGLPILVPGARMRRQSQSGSDCEIELTASRFHVGDRPVGSPASVRFQVTNLFMTGTSFEYVEREVGAVTCGRTVPRIELDLGEMKAELRGVFYHNENLEQAQETRGTAVTAELCFEIGRDAEIDKVQRCADDICLLLSLARGCRVCAVNSEVRDASGVLLHYYGRRLPRKGYSPQRDSIIDPYFAEHTKRFLEHCHPRVAAAKTEWKFDKAVEIYLDAKREGDEFELSGLKMVICMEFLHAQHVAREGRQTVVTPDQFSIAKRLIKSHLKGALGETAEGITAEQMCAVVKNMLKKMKEFNRPSFEDSLLSLNARQNVNARISPIAVKRFVAIRNSLVHQGTYREESDYGSPAEQYGFLDEYVGRFIYGMLGNPLDSVWRGYSWQSDGASVAESYAQDLV